MARRTIDVLAAGPPSTDLYDPASSGWALAGALAARGHDVQVVYPGPEGAPGAPTGVRATAFPPVTAHLGTVRGDAELARSGARHLRANAEIVLRIPAGAGALGGRPHGAPVVAFVQSLSGDAPPAKTSVGRVARIRARVTHWGERRDALHLEKEALTEAAAVYCAAPSLRDRLRAEYGLSAEQLRLASPAVGPAPTLPSRSDARRAVGVPDDVPLIAMFPTSEPLAEVPPAVIATFGRMRQLFVGCRLAAVGVPHAAAPGVVAIAGRDTAALAPVTGAADVGVVLERGPAPSAALALALRAGLPCVVAPGVDLGEGAEAAVRRADPEDPGALASALAELIADPPARAELGAAARRFAERFAAERLAAELEGLGAAARP